jgi:hypothetical protein
LFAAKRTIEFIDKSDAPDGAEEKRRALAMRRAKREVQQGRCRSADMFEA